MIFDTLEQLEAYISVLPQLRQIADAMDHDDIYDKAPGHYTTPAKNVTYEVMEYTTSEADAPFVFHKNKTIVEIVLSGNELMSTTWREYIKQPQAYNKEQDVGFVQGEPLSVLRASQGRFAVFFAGEPFKSGSAVGISEPVKKVIFTVAE